MNNLTRQLLSPINYGINNQLPIVQNSQNLPSLSIPNKPFSYDVSEFKKTDLVGVVNENVFGSISNDPDEIIVDKKIMDYNYYKNIYFDRYPSSFDFLLSDGNPINLGLYLQQLPFLIGINDIVAPQYIKINLEIPDPRLRKRQPFEFGSIIEKNIITIAIAGSNPQGLSKGEIVKKIGLRINEIFNKDQNDLNQKISRNYRIPTDPNNPTQLLYNSTSIFLKSIVFLNIEDHIFRYIYPIYDANIIFQQISTFFITLFLIKCYC